jgi:hypothetical protein
MNRSHRPVFTGWLASGFVLAAAAAAQAQAPSLNQAGNTLAFTNQTRAFALKDLTLTPVK